MPPFAGLRPLLLPLLVMGVALALFHLRVGADMGDFDVARSAGQRALSGAPLYPPGDVPSPFVHLPIVAVAMGPWALASHDAARIGWYAVSCALLMLLLRWSVIGMPARRWSDRTLIAVAVALLANYYVTELTLGQSTLVLSLLLLGTAGALQVEVPKLAAGTAAGAALLHPVAIIAVVSLTLTHGAGTGAVSIALIAAGLLLPALLYGWTGNLEQLSAWWHSTPGIASAADNLSVASVWAAWVGSGPLAAGLATVTAVLLLGVAFTVWRQRAHVQEPEYLEFALLISLLPLLAAHSPSHQLILATPALMLVVDRWRELQAPWRWTSVGALVILGGAALLPTSWGLPTVALVALVATLAQLRLRRLA
ncbi:MAG: DUF2029 domain-containing protein [Acidimicrobiia bacterium]|nr:DUF2029 domain-containing protein [Acidimicrobiia bacterium]